MSKLIAAGKHQRHGIMQPFEMQIAALSPVIALLTSLSKQSLQKKWLPSH
jgi:hypothetical protein